MASLPATNPLTYNGYVTSLATLAVVNLAPLTGTTQATKSAEFNLLIPQMLNYAELRIQRDADLFAAQQTIDGYSLTPASNIISIPQNDFVSVQNLRVANGTKKMPLTPVSKEALQNLFTDSSITGPPKVFAPLGGDATGATSYQYAVGPWPDQTYDVIATGLARLPSLALFANTAQAGTGLTFISTWLPDLLLMASMVFVSGYQRNFSSAGDDPNMSVNYEQQYQTLLKGAFVEEARKHFAARDWSPMAPAPIAQPVQAQG